MSIIRSRLLRPVPSRARITSVATLLLLAAGLGLGCEGPAIVEKAPVRPDPVKVDRPKTDIDVPQIMRGTVASEALVLGYRDVVVRGFGLVVGLRGTGSRVMPADVRAFMVREMGRRGVGLPPLNEFTPDELLDSMDTAVVIVEGIIPAGAPAGTRFDVRVYSAPGSSSTSLEGGRLFTCDLRPGQASTGNRQATILATAIGPVFVNPFVEPSRGGTATRLSGRILDGGQTVIPMPLKLRLYTPSHNRAATLQSAINSNFPREPGQREPTARGQSGEALEITIPPSFRNDTREFIELMRHTALGFDAPEAVGGQIRRALLAMPTESEHASWRWQSLGVRVLPTVQDLYSHPEELPRLAALRAGARLNDQLAVPFLVELARTGTTENRLTAIVLLSEMGLNPEIDKALQGLLQEDDVDVRAEAFLALAKRHDPSIQVRPQGKKFELWSGPSKVPTVFVSETGSPRLAIASNEPIQLELPITLRTWSNRLMIKGDLGSDRVEVYYRPELGNDDRTIAEAPIDLLDFVQFLAHRPSVEKPKPGLDLAYGEVIGVLYELVKGGYLKVDLKTDQDRLLARILKLEEEQNDSERPEFGDPDFDFLEETVETDGGAMVDGSLDGAGGGSSGAKKAMGDQLAPLGPPSAANPAGANSGTGGGTRGGIVPR